MTKIFISYCHADTDVFNRVKIHLTPLEKKYLGVNAEIDVWSDNRIKMGAQWKEEIRKALSDASVGIVIVSADFLASKFIMENELPPLLKKAKEKGALIIPIVAKPCLIALTELSTFQCANYLEDSIVSLSEWKKEEVFLKVAQRIVENRGNERVGDANNENAGRGENFLVPATWDNLLKIGQWSISEEDNIIKGAGMRNYLISKNSYGKTPFSLKAKLSFDKLEKDKVKTFNGANSGIIFGWHLDDQATPKYYNILLTGNTMCVESVGFMGGSETMDYSHFPATEVSLTIEYGKKYEFQIDVDENKFLTVTVDGALKLGRVFLGDIEGCVGLRPWRAEIQCEKFEVSLKLEKA